MSEEVETPKFKVGDKVRHIANPEFDMVIARFNTYYNKYTDKWDEKQFQPSELELVSATG